MLNFSHEKELIILENSLIKLEFNKKSKYFNLIDKTKQKHVISRAYSSILYDSKETNLLSNNIEKSDVKEFQNEVGKGIKLFLLFKSDKENLEFSLIFRIFENKPFIFLQNSIINRSEKGIRIKSLNPIILSNNNSSKLDLDTIIVKDWKILAGAYQSWAPVKLIKPFDKNFIPKVPDFIIPIRNIFLLNPKEKRQKYEYVGDNYIIIKNVKGHSTILFGFLTFKDQFTQIIFQFNKKNKTLEYLKAHSQADNIILEPNKEFFSELLMINFITPPQENLLLYAELIKQLSKGIPWDTVPTGYCTWYIYFQHINEKECLKNLDFLSTKSEQIPITYFQLDDGYQIDIGDWETNEKFPSGMKNFVEKVKERGFKPGLWIAPFFIAKNSKIFKKHPDWLLRDYRDKFVVVNKNPAWGYFNTIYALDCSHPEVQVWLRSLFAKITKEWGFECIKIDFIYAACSSTNFRNKKMTRAQVFRKGIEIIRETIGPDVLLLGCGAPIGPSIGVVNAMRVSADTGVYWDSMVSKFLRNSLRVFGLPCVINAMRNNIRSFFMHKKLWINDPDCLMVRLKKTKLKEEEIKSEITCIGLLNGYYFLSDDFDVVDKKQISLIKKFLPYNGITAIPIDLFENEIPQLLDLPLKTDFEEYHVIGVFNWTNKTKTITIKFEDLKLDKGKEYHVFEFWEKKYYGIYKNEIKIDAIKKHTCKLIAIRENKFVPQLLSSTFHFTQGGLEVKLVNYDKDTKKLYISLKFPKNYEGSLFLYNPEKTDWYIDEKFGCELVKETIDLYKLKIQFQNEFKILIHC